MAGTGEAPLTVRWVDVNQGDGAELNYRSRLVARQLRRKDWSPMFARTLPSESLRVVLVVAAM